MKKRLDKCVFILLLVTPVLAVLAVPCGYAQGQADSRTFNETGKTVSGRFLQYWEAHGGLAQQGYPISDEFTEVSALDGKRYTVQYFERAVFEWHPENAGTPYEVLLSQLGTLKAKQLGGSLELGKPAEAGTATR